MYNYIPNELYIICLFCELFIISNSVLNFTYGLETSKRLNFLDVTVTRGSNRLKTSVYIKPTYDNQILNYLSIAPIKYKISTIKTLLHRGFRVSDPWNTFHTEVIRIKNLLNNNNNFPIKLIEKEVNKIVTSKVKNLNIEVKDKVNFYFCNRMTEHYDKEDFQKINVKRKKK